MEGVVTMNSETEFRRLFILADDKETERDIMEDARQREMRMSRLGSNLMRAMQASSVNATSTQNAMRAEEERRRQAEFDARSAQYSQAKSAISSFSGGGFTEDGDDYAMDF